MKELLVIVDYQWDFVEGTLGFPEAKLLERPLCEKLEAAKKRGAQLLFTFDTHGADYLSTQEGQKLPIAHCIKGTPGWALYGAVADYCKPDTPRVEKPAFGSPELADFARQGEFERVELCGLVSNICVLSNAVLVKAALPEACVVVDARCTACMDMRQNEEALSVMEGLQIEVLNRLHPN